MNMSSKAFITLLVSAAIALIYWGWENFKQTETTVDIAISSPKEWAILSGIAKLEAVSSSQKSISAIQFRLDSRDICKSRGRERFTCEIDTELVGDGSVTLFAVAIDHSGKETISNPVNVMIQNNRVSVKAKQPSQGILRVPEDFETIQDGINAAGEGDTVLVSPGTYPGGIVISGKSINLVSKYHFTKEPSFVERTIISGGSPSIYVDKASPNTVIDGFQFVGGRKSVQFFGPGGRALNNYFENTGSDAISFENVGGDGQSE